MNNRIVIGLVALIVVLSIATIWAALRKRSYKLCPGCRRTMLSQWTQCMFCGWAPAARLEFILGPMANQTLSLTEQVTTIGSVAGNTVVLADPAVSRKHAGIHKVDSKYELADLGSTNGIYVNGHKVPKKTLEAGDIIRVGNTEAVFRRE